MSKRFKRIISLALCGIMLLLAACGNDGGNSNIPGPTGANGTAQGRYVETDITPPGKSLLEVLKGANDALVAFDIGMKTRWDSADGGKTWAETPGPGVNNPALADIQNLSMAEDGTIYGVLMVSGEDMYAAPECTPVKILPDGTMETLNIPLFNEKKEAGELPYIMNMQALPQNRLLLGFSWGDNGFATKVPEDGDEGEDIPPESGEPAESNTNEPTAGNEPEPPTGELEATDEPEEDDESALSMYSGAGMGQKFALYDLATLQEVADLGDTMASATAADAERLYSKGYDEGIQIRSLATGAQESEIPGRDMNDMTSFSMGGGFTVGDDGYLYSADNKRITRMAADGGASEVVTEASAFSFGLATNYIHQMLRLSDGSFVIKLVGGDGSSQLYRYEFDENATVDPNKVLKIWAMKDNTTVRAAMTEMMRRHPDATMELEIALDGEGGKTAADALQDLNTRMLAGDGPDILILDDTPMEQYAANGLLMNLKDKADFSAMYEELRAGFEKDGNIYYMPARYKLPMLIGDAGDIAGIDSLQQLVDAVVNGNDPAVLGNEVGDPFASVPREERPAMVFDGLNELFDLLWNSGASEVITGEGLNSDNLRTMLEAMKAISDKCGLARDPAEGSIAGGAIAMSSAGGEGSVITGSPIGYLSKRALMCGFTVGELLSTGMIEEKETAYQPFPGLAQGTWQPFAIAGVNAGTQREELAVEFIEALFSQEVQAAQTSGFPVSKAAADAQKEAINEIMKEHRPEGLTFDLDGMVKKLKTPVAPDSSLHDTFYDVADSYCRGTVTIDEAVSQIEQAVRNYLAERQ